MAGLSAAGQNNNSHTSGSSTSLPPPPPSIVLNNVWVRQMHGVCKAMFATSSSQNATMSSSHPIMFLNHKAGNMRAMGETIRAGCRSHIDGGR